MWHQLTPNIFPNKLTTVGRQVIVIEVKHIYTYTTNYVELIFGRNTIYSNKTSKGKIIKRTWKLIVTVSYMLFNS